jgi:hypothetical protein
VSQLREALRASHAAQGVEEWQQRKAAAAKAQRKALRRAKRIEREYKRQVGFPAGSSPSRHRWSFGSDGVAPPTFHARLLRGIY